MAWTCSEQQDLGFELEGGLQMRPRQLFDTGRWPVPYQAPGPDDETLGQSLVIDLDRAVVVGADAVADALLV